LKPGEVTYDPGASSEVGSKQAWNFLDDEFFRRYGFHFERGPCDANFRGLSGNVSSGSEGFYAIFDIPDKGEFVLAGVGIDNGPDPHFHTPILFGRFACKTLKLVTDHDSNMIYSKALRVGIQARECSSSHLALPIFDLLDLAGAVPRNPKNGHRQ